METHIQLAQRTGHRIWHAGVPELLPRAAQLGMLLCAAVRAACRQPAPCLNAATSIIVLLMMHEVPVAVLGPLHKQQFAIIQRVVCSFGIVYPAARSRRNTKGAWDDHLVDAGMQLLLMWDLYGHCHLQTAAWPAYARLTLSLFNYLGWRPVSLTHKPGEHASGRWGGRAVVAFGDCQLHWAGGMLVAVQIKQTRTKFNRNPLFSVAADPRTGQQVLVNRQIGVGKPTYSEQVDTCPCLAWLVWAVLNGVFGYAPYVQVGGGRGMMGHNARLQKLEDLSSEDVDRLVLSIFTVRPWDVPVLMRDVPLMTGQLLPGASFSVHTTAMSRVVTTIGIALGLNPCKCSAISGRKTVGTALTNHAQATDMDCTAALGHLNPSYTTRVIYADAKHPNADTTALVRDQPVRKMPGSVELAHTRNVAPNSMAGRSVGQAAKQACLEFYARRGRRVPAAKVQLYAQNAYNKAFRAEMQRQFDVQAGLSKCGDADEVLHTWFFTPLCFEGHSQADLVSWQVKRALGLV